MPPPTLIVPGLQKLVRKSRPPRSRLFAWYHGRSEA